jgi:hypothetical protein
MPFIEVPEGDGDNIELDPAFREPLTVGRPIESA